MSTHEPESESHPQGQQRRRWVRRLLRFAPRRAVFHKYPLIGRFAPAARRRAYLWSFKSRHMRPAFYAGSILSLLPVMGVQLPLALGLALILRANFMVLGGLQLVTNPFTAAPIYYATHQLGSHFLSLSGLHGPIEITTPLRVISSSETRPAEGTSELSRAPASPARKERWTKRVGAAINGLVVGGALAGTFLGFALDLLWQRITRHRPPPKKVSRASADSHSTDSVRPPS
jgi:uncharacterized protein (DUF2062 family)